MRKNPKTPAPVIEEEEAVKTETIKMEPAKELDSTPETIVKEEETVKEEPKVEEEPTIKPIVVKPPVQSAKPKTRCDTCPSRNAPSHYCMTRCGFIPV